MCDTDSRRTKCEPFSSEIHKTYKPRIPLGKAWELEWVSVKPKALVHLDFPSYCPFFLNALSNNAFVLGKLDVMLVSACELQEEKVN